MKTILSSRRDRYLAKFSIFLIAVALIAGMVGCTPERWNLTISSTEGGKVTSPGEGTFRRGKGTVVSLVAELDEGYQFVNWTGDVDTIADVNAAATNITMDGDYSIKANFAIEILEIWDWNDLNAIRNNLHSQHILMTSLNSTSANYTELAGPKANGGDGWEPIGTLSRPFTGSFDGQNYTIMGLFIDRPDEDNVGLFGYVEEGAVVENIGLVNATVTGEDHVGSLVGMNDDESTVSNSYSTGNVTGEKYVGGLVGFNYKKSTVSDSDSAGNVTGEKYVGGLVGCNDKESTVSNSYSTGSVTGGENVGGLIGFNDKSTVKNSHYNYDEVLVLINGQAENIITIGALYGVDFERWLNNDKFLDVNKRLDPDPKDGYYLINNVTHFKELLAFGQDSTLIFKLTKDLDLSDEANFYIPYFAGKFYGNNHKISNFSFNFDFAYNVGLFGCLSGRVTQVCVENVKITGASYIGGLVGASWEGTVEKCYSTGSVNGNDYVGGLVGCNYEESYVNNSYSTGSVKGKYYVGGLVGDNEYTVSRCHFTGNVTSEQGSYIGGLVGWNENKGEVKESSYSTGSVKGKYYVGGLVGRNLGKVSESYSNSTVSGDKYVGGLLGANDLTVEKSYSSGNVIDSYQCVGGLLGKNDRLVSNCYSTGNVSGDSRVGGLVGCNYKDSTVNGSYSTGRVSDGEDVGGLVGQNYDGTVTRSFWNTETSGQATSAAEGEGKAEGKNTTKMWDITTFSAEGWDIVKIEYYTTETWYIEDGKDYPRLGWQL